jgi:hypothetical protein
MIIVTKPLLGDRRARTPGMLHLLISYVWLFLPVVVAPLIVAQATDFPVQEVSGSGGPILVFGWVLQFGYALVPYLFARFFEPDQPAHLGGTWLSLVSMNLGAVLFWISLFFPGAETISRVLAYAFWTLSGVPILTGLWKSFRSGMKSVEASQAVMVDDEEVGNPGRISSG